MRRYRIVGITLLLLLTAVWANAFQFDIHVAITREALDDLRIIWTPLDRDLIDPVKTGFSDAAVKEITEANIAKDTGDSGGQSGCNGSMDPDAIAVPCGGETEFGRMAAAVEFVNREPHFEHFDAETFQEGNRAVFNARVNIIFYLQQRRFIAARKLLGGLLHAVQDFYAHSNYVELNYGDQLEDRLGQQNGFAGGIPQVAATSEATCNTGSDLLEHFQHPNPTMPDGDDRLTSGIWVGTDMRGNFTDPMEITQLHKCRHGMNIQGINVDSPVFTLHVNGSQPGINKDNDVKPLFPKARRLAKFHTERFVADLLDDRSLSQDPTIILRLMGHPTISSLSPLVTTGTVLTNLSVALPFDVLGEGFVPKSVVYWNDVKLTTQFISNTQLHASVNRSDIPQQLDRVKVTVKNPGTELDGTEVLFSSNARPPSIADIDCPPNGHVHDPNYPTDVNANRWNDTGLLVKQGQRLNIQVKQNAVVVWRAGGLLSGSAGVARPQGDPTATPMNTLLWVDPPIDYRLVPIGALIGMVVPANLLDASGKPTMPLIEKPDGVKYFPVLTGGRFVPPMPVAGRLYLGINDGAFFNNEGCFQTHVSPAS